MNSAEEWLVYENLFELAASRGVKVSTERLDNRRFNSYINYHESITVEGRRDGKLPDGKADPRGASKSLFILVGPTSEAGKKTRDMRKVLPKEVTEPTEILLIAKDEPTKNVIKAMTSYQSENPACSLSIHSYEKFISDPRKHAMVSPTSIVDEAEFAQMREDFFMDAVELPRISRSDAQAVWLGLRPGMIAMEERYTETSGIMTVYMRCF